MASSVLKGQLLPLRCTAFQTFCKLPLAQGAAVAPTGNHYSPTGVVVLELLLLLLPLLAYRLRPLQGRNKSDIGMGVKKRKLESCPGGIPRVDRSRSMRHIAALACCDQENFDLIFATQQGQLRQILATRSPYDF